MTDKTLADLFDDIPDDTKDWLRGYDADYVANLDHADIILSAVKRHLPDPPSVPAVGDWVTIEETEDQKYLVVLVTPEWVYTAAGASRPGRLSIANRTFRPAERPEVTS